MKTSTCISNAPPRGCNLWTRAALLLSRLLQRHFQSSPHGSSATTRNLDSTPSLEPIRLGAICRMHDLYAAVNLIRSEGVPNLPRPLSGSPKNNFTQEFSSADVASNSCSRFELLEERSFPC